MVANDSKNPKRAPHDCLSQAELAMRLEEEINRAGRHRTALSCLLVCLQDVEQLARVHGTDLPAQAIAYLGVALGRELRLFDRVGHVEEGELLVVLPGADERRGEIVARRALGRLHAVKIEMAGQRRALQISVGIAAWREGLTGEQLLSQTRRAARREEHSDHGQASSTTESLDARAETPVLRRS